MKKILVFTDPQMDYGNEGILCGLHENPDFDVYEMTPWQHVRGGVDAGYDLADKPGGGYTSAPGHLSNPLPPYKHTKEEIFDIGRDFDLIALLGYRDYALRGAKEYFDVFPPYPWQRKCGLVVCDAEDADQVNVNIIDLFQPEIYFKRELIRGKMPVGYVSGLQCSIYPLPFSAFVRSYPTDIDDQDKRHDLFFSVGNTYPGRMDLVRQLVEYGIDRGIRHHIATNDNTEFYKKGHPLKPHMANMPLWSDYIREQAQSKIVPVIRGWGRDALHTWEAFSYASVIILFDNGLYYPYPFVPGKHCLTAAENDSDGLYRVLDMLLANDGLCRELGQAGKEHCRKYHTNLARANFMVNLGERAFRNERIRTEEFGITPIWTV